MKCFGYYIVKLVEKPDYVKLDVDNILSVGEFVNDLFPDLTKCYWVNIPEKDKTEYKEYLKLTDDEFSEFCKYVSDLIDRGLMSPHVKFSRIEDAVKMRGYLKNVEGYKIIGVFTSSQYFAEYEEGETFKIYKAGEECSIPRKYLGIDILGCECGGPGAFWFDCYLDDNLNEEIEKHPDSNYKVSCETGLILNSFEEAEKYCDWIQEMGEDVVWTPFEVYEYLI